VRVAVNGCELFVDLVGAKLVPEGARMRERPTLVLLHGGPGADHSIYRPLLDPLAEGAQLLFYDHRGNGRSGESQPEHWHLAQWADDLAALLALLGIERPVVYGASFGGMVAQAFVLRHPGVAAGLILESTAARGGAHTARRVAQFGRLGGAEVEALARRRLLEGDTGPDVLADWMRLCVPLYTRRPLPPEWFARIVSRPAVTRWFSDPQGEMHRFDFRADLARVRCPVLLMGGSEDPMIPIENLNELAAALPQARVEVFEGARHILAHDEPARFFATVREFLSNLPTGSEA
jgi:proline-specific peptidase